MERVVNAIMASLMMGRTKNFQLCSLVVKAGEIFHCLNKSHLPYYLLLMQSWINY